MQIICLQGGQLPCRWCLKTRLCFLFAVKTSLSENKRIIHQLFGESVVDKAIYRRFEEASCMSCWNGQDNGAALSTFTSKVGGRTQVVRDDVSFVQKAIDDDDEAGRQNVGNGQKQRQRE